MKLFILCLVFISAVIQSYPLTPSAITREQAEDIYSDALTLNSEGNTDEGLKKLKLLADNGFKDKYIYYSLLDTYVSKLQELQLIGTADSPAVKKVIAEARNYCSDAIALYPDDKKLLYKYTDLSRSLGEFKAFYDTLQKLYTLDETDTFANYWLGAYHFDNKEYKKASGYFETVISSPRKNEEFDWMAVYRSYYDLGMISASEQNYRIAAQYLEKAREIYAKDYDLIKRLVYIYGRALEFKKVIENFRLIPDNYPVDEFNDTYEAALFITDDKGLSKVIKQNKNESLFVKSIGLYENKEYSNALKILGNYLLDKNFSDYYDHYLLYKIYEAQNDTNKMVQQAILMGTYAKDVGKLDIAIEYYSRAVDNPKSIPDIYWLIGSLYDDLENYTNAVKYYELYINHPDSKEYRIPALVRLSFMYYKTKNDKKSDEIIQIAKSTAVTPDDQFQVYFYSGLRSVEKKDYPASIVDFEKALESNKENPRIYYFLGTAYYEIKNRKKAITSLEIGREKDKDNPEMNNLLAYLYSLENINLDEAVKLVNVALIASPDNFAYLDTLGWIYYQKGETARAFEIFNKILAIFSKEPPKYEDGLDEIYYHLGMVYDKMGNHKEAKSYFQKGYKINPKNELLKAKVKPAPHSK
jgi:tetratricopeptide (TPR) repeat protein